MSGHGRAWRRRGAGAVANLALLATVGGVVTYAVAAEGYSTHRAELNDGGIWVTNSHDGYYGRINKPIGQQDASTFAALDDQLDVVQDGSAVVGVEVSGRGLLPIDPSTATVAADAGATLPRAADVQLAGGTLAVLDTSNGAVRAARVDPGRAAADLRAVAVDAPRLAKVGVPAALAVTVGGTVLAASGADDTLIRLAPASGGFTAATSTTLDVPVDSGLSLTAVGETPVVLDSRTGDLFVPGGVRAVVEPGAVLQAPGPAADSVLLATAEALLTVDLATGELTVLQSAARGRPTPPVRLGACVFGAWSGGLGSVATQCGSGPAHSAALTGEATDLVFRVNRGQIVLNDRFSGRVWNVNLDQPQTLDDWPSFRHRNDQESKDPDTEKNDAGDRRPPKAEPDQFGARPGRTTVLYPLDNDSAPAGRILAIRSVNPISRNGAKLTISPDGQTVQLKLPPRASAPTSFEYFIDDGRQISDHSTVTVTTRRDGVNQAPALREGFTPRVWPVAAGGATELPVLPDWRDARDGDVLAVATAAVKGNADGATARTTASGRLRFAAPPNPGPVTVSYSVTDGRSAPVPAEITFRVLDPDRDHATPAVAEPDISSVEVGKWVTIRPLANDLSGSDPLSPRAQLALASALAPVAGAQVRTDLADGTVSFRSGVARTYSLGYDVAYGDAPLAHSKIRVDVRPRERRAPVAMPDSATLYGSAPGLVDVLANDLDPAGGMLAVQGARALNSDQVDVAVVEGRWVRISAREGQLRPSPQVVRYTVSNGGPPVAGEITVTQRDALADNTPVTTDDQVTVRAGAAVTVPVLDNDYSPSGDPLSLVPDVPGEKAGQLAVTAEDGSTDGIGQATVSGRMVRYVAPAGLRSEESFVISYLVTNSAGETAPGELRVSVIPVNRPNGAPEPPLLEGRAVAGGTVVLKLPGAGIDPDGDAVGLVGLSTAPALGRVVKLGANTIEYQAFPNGTGTDEFDYVLADSQGLEAVGTARVAVAPSGAPQPPLAVADTLTVEPGRQATVDPLGNDLVAPGDRATLELVDPPAGVTLESATGPVTIVAPARSEGRNVEVVYRLTNGLDSSQATITVRTATPYNNPPVVFDAYGKSNDSAAVRVAVLRTAYDPDGPSDQLRVTDVFAPAGVTARAVRGRITVTRGPQALVIPFRVEDADGGAALAQVYVPAIGTNRPYAKPGAVIRLTPGDTVRARLADYVVNPSGGGVRLSVQPAVSASPTGGVNAVAASAAALSVTAASGYTGPGVVAFRVVPEAAAASGDPGVLVTVPVQIGQDKPILTCPADPVEVRQGGQVGLDISSICNVYTPNPKEAASLSYAADWLRVPEGLSIVDPSGPSIAVAAASSVKAGSEGVLLVSAGGGRPSRIRVRVTDAPPPSLAPIRISDMKAGESRTVDLAPYLTAGVPQPVPTVLRATPLSGLNVKVVPAGGSVVRITTGGRVAGHAEFRVVMSDVASTTDPARQATNVLSMDLLDVPDAPSAPVPSDSDRSGTVQLTWRPPDANGSPIDYYEVRSSAGQTRRCPGTSCAIDGLKNGRLYTFTVRAHNALGWSDASPRSRGARPVEKPGQVGPIRMTKQGDGRLTIAWDPPRNPEGITGYTVTWRGGRAEPRGTSLFVTGLVNNQKYWFTVVAHNALGAGPPRKAGPFESVGPPGTPQKPTVVDVAPSTSVTAQLLVTWPIVPSTGSPVTYTLQHQGFAQPGCARLAVPTCLVSGVRYDGSTHSFSVIATAGRDRTARGPEATWTAVATPLSWGAWSVTATGNDSQARASFRVPNSRGDRSDVQILVDGSVALEIPEARGALTRNFAVGDNDRPHRVELRLCNESGCAPKSSAQQVQTFGPLTSGNLQNINVIRSGTTLEWRITVDANGAPATLTVESDAGRPTQRFSITNIDVSTVTTGSFDLGYSATEKITVTLADRSPRDRGPVMKRDAATTEPRPSPVVKVSRARKCSDEPGSSLDPCHPPGSSEDCVDPSCGFIAIEVRNFFSPVTCVVTRQGPSDPVTVGPINDNTTRETALYFGTPGDWVKAVCTDDDTGNIQASDKYIWPN